MPSAAETKDRRDSIRNTWAIGHSVFFIVAGPWEDIEEEYDEYEDLIWVDQGEIYTSTSGGLTFKSYVFLGAMYDKVREANPHVEYFFKTDDDVYVDMVELTKALGSETNDGEPLDYWGTCFDELIPQRGPGKWFVSYKTYPFAYFPPYCIGLGYAISERFLDCAVRDGHLEKVRFIPNEDTAVGMLAERCNMEFPDRNSGDKRNHLTWDEEKPLTMNGKIIQHNVKRPEHMLGFHNAAEDGRKK